MSKRKKKREKTKIFAGRYAYRKPLGRGAGGSVYLAEDLRRDDREVALKVLSAEACETVQGKMLRREFEILSKLDHPNLVRVYDYGTLPGGGVFLAEEYIDGFSMQDARALLEPAALIDPTLQILQGLSYLHAMGMIHRDIKPANVMLLWLDDASARPMVKLVDFGLSSMNPKRDTLRGGTRSYMAPEIIRGDKAETRSDLYSLGVTLYYALCGVLPFGPRNKEDPPPTEEDFRPPEPHRLNEDVPLELSRFTMALLRQVPAVDYADAGEALQALAADAGELEERSVGQMANSLDVSAAPVIRGYFERGILSRRIEEDDLLLEWLSMSEDDGSGQMYLVRGESGVGKTRLLHDVQASAKLSGHLVISLQCEAGGGVLELAVEMVDRLVEVAKSHGVVTVEKYEAPICVQRLVTDLQVDSELLGELGDPGWMRRAIEDCVAILGDQKVVFFVDDIDLADRASKQLLGDWFEAGTCARRPAVVATLNKGPLYKSLSRNKGVEVLPIEGVGRADVEAFLCDQLGVSGLSLSWIKAVAQASEGRPAYIEELCRYLIDAGMLWRDSSTQWKARVDDIEASGVPASLRESLRRRVTAVGASGRECLELLALMERSLPWQVARRLLERGGSTAKEAEQTLQTVQWRHLVKMDLTPIARFVRVVHRELGEAVADMLSPEWRRALHRRIGEELVLAWQQGRGDASEAAHHLEQGWRDEEASAFFEIAGDKQLWTAQSSAAIEPYQRALEGSVHAPNQALLHSKLARAYLARFDAEQCRQQLREASELACSTEREWLIYRVGIDAAYGMYAMGDVRAAREQLETLRQDVAQMSDGTELVVLDAMLEANEGNLELAARKLETCMAAADRPLIPQRRVEVLASKARIDALCGRRQQASESFDDALSLASMIGDPVTEGTVLLYQGTQWRRSDDPVKAREALLEALPLLSGGRSPHHFVETLFQLAWALTELGSSVVARRRAAEALFFARRLGHEIYHQKAAILLGSLVLSRREVDTTSLQDLDEALEAFERVDTFSVDRSEVLMALGDLMITLQMKDEGPPLLQRGRQLAYEVGADGLLPPVEE